MDNSEEKLQSKRDVAGGIFQKYREDKTNNTYIVYIYINRESSKAS